jgi:hypothetical protein
MVSSLVAAAELVELDQDSQEDDAEEDEEVEVEYVSNAQGKAEHYA